MTAASPNPRRGAQPGNYQRVKPIRQAMSRPYLARIERVDAPTDLDLWWSRDGRVWLDEDFERFSGWTMVRIIEELDDDD